MHTDSGVVMARGKKEQGLGGRRQRGDRGTSAMVSIKMEKKQ